MQETLRLLLEEEGPSALPSVLITSSLYFHEPFQVCFTCSFFCLLQILKGSRCA